MTRREIFKAIALSPFLVNAKLVPELEELNNDAVAINLKPDTNIYLVFDVAKQGVICRPMNDSSKVEYVDNHWIQSVDGEPVLATYGTILHLVEVEQAAYVIGSFLGSI